MTQQTLKKLNLSEKNSCREKRLDKSLDANFVEPCLNKARKCMKPYHSQKLTIQDIF